MFPPSAQPFVDLDDKDDGTLTAALIGGNIGLLAAIPLDARWTPLPDYGNSLAECSQVNIQNVGVTAGLALCTLGLIVLGGVRAHGVLGFLKQHYGWEGMFGGVALMCLIAAVTWLGIDCTKRLAPD